jgi:hypothetical protein
MFNKKTLAAALVLASPLSFGAITVTTDGAGTAVVRAVNSAEAGVAAETNVADFVVELDAQYLQTDQITLTFSGADLADDFSPNVGTITGDAAGTIAFLRRDGNVLTYRVTSANTTADEEFSFDFADQDFRLDTSGLTGTGSVSYKFASSIEESADITILSYGTQEFSVDATAAADKANALVDVTNDRLTFALVDNANEGHSAAADIITIGISDAANDGADPANAYTVEQVLTTGTTFTVTGDFSWMAETNDDGDLVTRTGYSLTAADVAAANAPVTIADDYQSVSWAATDQGGLNAGDAVLGDYKLTITVPVAGDANSVAKIVPEDQFTGSVKFVWGAGDDDNRTDSIADLGSHGLNATSVTAYSMPFSASVIQFLYVSNGSDTAGDVTATYTHEGEVSAEYEVGTVGEYSSTNVFSDLKAAVEAAGDVFPSTGRGDITVTVTSSDTEVLPSYYKDGDRLGLESSESLND